MQNTTTGALVHPPTGPLPSAAPLTPGDILMAAREADHLARCPKHREQHEEAEARYTEYGASLQRRDRVQLGLRSVRKAVTR